MRIYPLRTTLTPLPACVTQTWEHEPDISERSASCIRWDNGSRHGTVHRKHRGAAVPACRRPSRTLAPLVSLAALSWPGHSPPSPDRPELSWIRVPARTGSKRWPRRGGKPRRGRRSDTGPVLWPHLALARQEHRFVWRRRLAQSGRAVVSPRDVKLAPRSRRGRVKMLDVAIRVTATYPAKWLLAPVEGRHTSSAR